MIQILLRNEVTFENDFDGKKGSLSIMYTSVARLRKQSMYYPEGSYESIYSIQHHSGGSNLITWMMFQPNEKRTINLHTKLNYS